MYNIILFNAGDILGVKSDGFNIRQLEFLITSLITIFFHSFSGNGWGAGWKELIEIEMGNIFSRGVNDGSLNFVWHNPFGGLFHRQGIIYF